MKLIDARKLQLKLNLVNLVVIPFILVLLYYTLLATDRFTSQAIITIKGDNGAMGGLELGLLGLGGASGLEDERIVKEYMLSNDMLTYLNENIQHKEHFQSDDADYFSRLSKGATREEYIQYYQEHVDIYLDETSGFIQIDVQAFDAKYAMHLLNTMLEHSENVINGVSHSLALEQHRFLEQELGKSQVILKEAKQRLLEFQNQYNILSPELEGKALTSILDSLEGELVLEKAKLRQLLATQKASSPQVKAVKERISALRAQITDERGRLVGEGDRELNDLILEYSNLQLNVKFAEDSYASTLAALGLARSEASKKMKHLVVISKPTLAQEALYPDRLYILSTVLLILIMTYGIVRMTISTIREHQD